MSAELNEQVARKLGWTNLHKFDVLPHLLGEPNGAKSEYPNEDGIAKVPDYCGSIEAAWEIVEFIGKTHSMSMYWLGKEDGSRFWRVGITGKALEDADTAPLSIVKAFLKMGDR